MNIEFREVATMPPVCVRLTHSKKKLRKWLRRFEADMGNVEEVLERSDAVTNSFSHSGTGELLHVVYMAPDIDRDAALDAGLLAHEATHVAQEYFKSLGEDRPSDELQAYVVQHVTTYLVGKHYEWKRRQLDKRNAKH